MSKVIGYKNGMYVVEAVETRSVVKLYKANSKSDALCKAEKGVEPEKEYTLETVDVINIVSKYNDRVKPIITDDDKHILVPGWLSLRLLQKELDISINLTETLCLYHDSKVVNYWEIELDNDRVMYEVSIDMLTDNDWFYGYLKSNDNGFYTKNRNGEYPLK